MATEKEKIISMKYFFIQNYDDSEWINNFWIIKIKIQKKKELLQKKIIYYIQIINIFYMV